MQLQYPLFELTHIRFASCSCVLHFSKQQIDCCNCFGIALLFRFAVFQNWYWFSNMLTFQILQLLAWWRPSCIIFWILLDGWFSLSKFYIWLCIPTILVNNQDIFSPFSMKLDGNPNCYVSNSQNWERIFIL